MNQTFTMKKLKFLFFAVLFCTPLIAVAQNIEINVGNFPDENFRSWLLEQDYGKDGILTEEEIEKVIEIVVPERNISSLKGIEYFTALIYLDCYNNQLTSLDVSHNLVLTELYCFENQLTSLNVSECPALTYLSCDENQLTSLDVSHNLALTELHCSYNQLTTLDVSQNIALTSLWCHYNQLTSLDLSQNTALIGLLCWNNRLSLLDLSKNIALTELICYDNQLSTLDVSNNTALTGLQCSRNQLTSLDVSHNPDMYYLYCDGNQLKALDVSQNTALSYLDCGFNQLTSLDVSKNPALTTLYCCTNQIKGEAMDALISTLPQNTSTDVYGLYVYDSIALGEGNVCTQKQVATAKDKGWTSYYRNAEWEWIVYEGCDDAAGIALPEAETENGNAPVYNLSGQKVTSPVKGGIYIVDGKKMVVK